MTNTKITVTERIRQLIIESRKSCELTASELSVKMGKSEYWLSNIENGRTKSISNTVLIEILKLGFKCSDDDAAQMISDSLLNSSPQIGASDVSNLKEVHIYSEDDILEDTSKYRSEFDKLLENTKDGFNFFFDRVSDKKRAVSMLKMINANLHSELGFIISLYSLPWFLLTEYPIEKKKEFMKQFSNFISENKIKSKNKDEKASTESSNDNKAE